MVRSLLQYPGGKFRGVPALLPYIPPRRRVVSPFFGGGTLELALEHRRQPVRGYDLLAPLVSFWQHAIRDAAQLAEEAAQYLTLDRPQFQRLQQSLMSLTGFEQAVAFYVLSRTAFSGMALSSGMRDRGVSNRFTPSILRSLAAFRAPFLEVEQADFREVIPAHPQDFLFLDPPYMVNTKLYGYRGDLHDGFDHEALWCLLLRRSDWVLTYNDCPEVRALYAGCAIDKVSWSYGMNRSKQSSEVIIRPAGSAPLAKQMELF